ncbi:putative glutathione S-transferase GSTU6 [Dichanthelium oligosanthes]|uniref:glutathione transferase n=1 Tax=Dichanthelium oligosanthes TaxID=888268 RepID=A0A1E5USZ3_9POAL|nr:putative glutathione S-transferase GSTU6 [Dichanthelium oligosanthes]
MWASPYVMRVKLALGFKGLSYEYVEDLFSGKSELLLKSNPVHKKVPVLLHNGKPVCEIIVQYIDEAFAGTAPSLVFAVGKGKTEEEKAEGLKQTLVAAENMEAAFKEISKGKPFFGGDTVGYLDVTLGALVAWVYAAEKLHGFPLFDATRSPLLNAWVERFKEQNTNWTMAGGGDELKLLGMWASPFALRVRLALSFKGLRYEYIEEDLGNKSDLLLTSNPVHKKVPVLIHSGKPACESQVIVQYLDEVFRATGLSLLPADPYERAMARFWAAFIDDKLLASWALAARGKTMEEKMELLKPTFAAVETLEAAFRECSKGKPFFGGDNVGYLDVMLGGLVAWVHASEARHGLKIFDPSGSPLLDAWVERFSELDETKAVLPDIKRLVEYANMREAQAAATN